MVNKSIRFFLENRLVVAILLVSFILLGIVTTPFEMDTGNKLLNRIPRDPVPVDAIPDLGENQQIIFTEWTGRSPQDIEDQITYPLTSALLGIPGIKTVRSNSIFGLSSIYLIFEEDIEFYWSRSRILEKLNSLSNGVLPQGVQPALGPDATALGQIFWYTLEGRDPKTGAPKGGWDPQELRSIQDYQVGYALSSASGVAEVAAVGGFVKEYQVDIDPLAMQANGVNVNQIMRAVQQSNQDVGARTIEFNQVEYLIRGLGYVKGISDLEQAVVTINNNTPVRLKDVARVHLGPASRRGGLDKEGSEATGAVVVARYGTNPLAVIQDIKAKIAEIAPGLPQKILADGTISKVTIVPFYDRTGLIKETIGTLEVALEHEILISIVVVLILLWNVRASIIISSLLPLAVLCTFIIMKYVGIEANIVALSGIAIAIGVMVDVGIVFTENIIRHLQKPENQASKGQQLIEVIYVATTEVASPIITALATTIISFLPVFALQGAEGKMFHPLAFTKTFALGSALLLGLIMLPTLVYWIYSIRINGTKLKRLIFVGVVLLGLFFIIFEGNWLGLALVVIGLNGLLQAYYPNLKFNAYKIINICVLLITAVWLLADSWLPLGPQRSVFVNLIFVAMLASGIIGLLWLVSHFYRVILGWCLRNKWQFLSLPIIILIVGLMAWIGFSNTMSPISSLMTTLGWEDKQMSWWHKADKAFPGMAKEFMPTLDEGSFLLMPTTMAHSGVGENLEVIKQLDRYVAAIPEVETVVGKWGRVNSALDPAPISMFENTINYKPEYVLDENGRRKRFKVDGNGAYFLNDGSRYDPDIEGFKNLQTELLVPDKKGAYYRQWRPEIKSSDDVWDEIIKSTRIPGMTSAPKLQPIETRLVMLSTGMRAPMGIKVYGPDLATIDAFSLQLEAILKNVPGVKPSSVFADRIVGKPYMEFNIDRRQIGRYGLSVADFQRVVEVAIGGINLTTTVEGRERFAVRVRYARAFRDNPNDVGKILIPTPTGAQIPLGELAEITYRRGPQMVKSEDTFLVGYVIFDKQSDQSPVKVVEESKKLIAHHISNNTLQIPNGVSYRFTGEYENQQRASERLTLIIPIALIAIFLLLYFQFKDVALTLMVFSGVFVAFAGGFIVVWLYGQDWFLNVNVFGMYIRDLFNMQTINLSVAVWVGFIALFGIATDDGLLMGTYLKQSFRKNKPKSLSAIRTSVIEAGSMRVKPAIMTTATTLIALIPVLASTGKGSEIMVPMAIPLFGGMVIQVLTMFIVPVLYAARAERNINGLSKSV
jgi:Cu(I)/Ag(I) efflux system membrane protein CusA/SilA